MPTRSGRPAGPAPPARAARRATRPRMLRCCGCGASAPCSTPRGGGALAANLRGRWPQRCAGMSLPGARGRRTCSASRQRRA
eukprot:1085914-Pyramimonas_sp.AAC.1